MIDQGMPCETWVDAFGETCQHFAWAAFDDITDACIGDGGDAFDPAHGVPCLADEGVADVGQAGFDFDIDVVDDGHLRAAHLDGDECFGEDVGGGREQA